MITLKSLGWALVFVSFLLVAGCGAPAAPDPAPPTPTVDEQELSDDFAEYMRLNFGIPGSSLTSWYPLIESWRISVSGNSFRIYIDTDIYPDGDAAQPAQGIAGAVKSWALGVMREKGIGLKSIQVFGKRGDQQVPLRTWDTTWGWRDY